MSGKRALIRGTAILTITSFVTRFMGFFYRIFLGHTFGEENVGLYQLVFPVYALGISFSCAGTELALSRCVAQENAAGHPEKAKELLKTGLIFTFVLSCILTIFLQHNAHMTAISFLHDSRCEELLILLSYTFPFASIHSCICGYSLGLKQTKIPAVSQLFEQTFRIFSVITAPAISWIFPSLLPLLVLLWGRSLHLVIACTLYTTQLRNKCRICFLQVLSASIFPGFSDTPFLLLPAGYY